VPRWLAHLLVVCGWLLTPILAWGASYVGLWIGATVALRFAQPITMLLRSEFHHPQVSETVLKAW